MISSSLWLAVRIPDLNNRPMHGDEAVNAYRVGELLESGRYVYQASEHHGPTLIYAGAILAGGFGADSLQETSEFQLRMTNILAGLILIWVMPLMVASLGRLAVSFAAMLIIFDPAYSFYVRYFIHETMLLSAAGLAIAAGWRFSQSARWYWASLLGISLALMFATKITSVLMFAAAGVALLPNISSRSASNFRWQPSIAVAVSFLVTWAMLYSSFGTNVGGLSDSLIAFGHYFERGMGGNPSAADHLHPWYYHLLRLLWIQDDRGFIWSYGLVLLMAAIGGYHWRARDLTGFLVRYGLLLLLMYSLIPYKTPWLVMGPLYVILLLAGFGAAKLFHSVSSRAGMTAAVIAISIIVAYQATQTWRACYVHPAHPRNPYVYSQTSPDLLGLVQRGRELSDLAQVGKDELLGVYADYPWPLPWYWRDLPVVGYWETLPESFYAQPPRVFVISPKLAESLSPELAENYLLEYYGNYHGAHLMLAIENGLWERYMESR